MTFAEKLTRADAAGITWDTVLDTVETLCMKTLDDHAFGDELPQEESQFEMHLL